MPIHLSIKSPYVSGLDVSDTIIAAFAEASYPIKVKVSNASSDKGLFPEVSGIVVPPHDPQSNDFAISKKISLAGSADVAKLAANVEYLAEQSKDSDVLFVISEISADEDTDEWEVIDDESTRQSIEKVSIDQTTPGTTDSVTVKAAGGIGSLTEAAPDTDTASSGLNGRLQRVAQRLTALIGLLPAALTGSGNLKTAILEALPAGTNSIGKIEEQTIDVAATQSVAIGAASEASSAVGSTTNRVVLSATVDCWVAVGADPTAAANTAGSFFLAAGAQSYPLKVTPSTTKIAVIKDSEDGYLSVIESL